MSSVIKTEHLSKIFDGEGVATMGIEDISINIDEGEFVAIMGPSGSGKSTLLHILGLLLPPSSGKYFLFGKDINEYKENDLAKVRNKDFGFVFQSFYLLARNTVRDNVALPLLYSGVPEREWNGMVERAVASVDLTHRIDYPTSQLSGGEKQRVAMARALVNNPKVIFADEPTGNLDLKSGALVMNILKRLREEMGYTIILITHEGTTASFAERMYYIEDGKVVKQAKISELEGLQIKMK